MDFVGEIVVVVCVEVGFCVDEGECVGGCNGDVCVDDLVCIVVEFVWYVECEYVVVVVCMGGDVCGLFCECIVECMVEVDVE